MKQYFLKLVKDINLFSKIRKLERENNDLKERCNFLELERERLIKEQVNILRSISPLK